MIGVDFRNPGIAEQIADIVVRTFVRARAFRIGLLVLGLLLAFVGGEALRLGSALHNIQRLERQRFILAADVENLQARVKAIRERRTALLNALARRRANVELASRIATASDLLAVSMALTELIAAPDGFDLQGSGTSLSDVRASLGRLEATFDRPATFELQRDELSPAAVSFHFGIARR